MIKYRRLLPVFAGLLLVPVVHAQDTPAQKSDSSAKLMNPQKRARR